MTATTPQELAAAALPARRAGFPYWHELILAVLLVAVMLVAGWLQPRFVRPAVQVGLALSIEVRVVGHVAPNTFFVGEDEAKVTDLLAA